jgi:peptidyl serine alpha-galactosyltransferase
LNQSKVNKQATTIKQTIKIMLFFQSTGKVLLNRGNNQARSKSKRLHFLVIQIIFGIVFLSAIILTVSLYTKVLLNTIPSSNIEQSTSSSSTSTTSSIKYHIVFSTGCSVYQDWQSYVFFYQAYAIQQGGIVTRIVSGCNDTEQHQLQTLFDEQIRTMVFDSASKYNNNFRIHFTPDYSKLKPSEKYVYFNKPYGMKHWMEHVLGFSSSIEDGKTTFSSDNVQEDDKDSIIVLMDPDQIFMRKFENNNFTSTDWFFVKEKLGPRTSVSKGYPMGQLYGYGLQWKQKINMTTVLNSIPKMAAGKTTPIDTMTNDRARAGYVVGPPYVAIASDMYQIVVTWSQFVIPVHDQYPHLLAEMFAYSLAAAHLLLHHQTATSFMVTDTHISHKGEGWKYVNDMPLSDVCTSHRTVRQEHINNHGMNAIQETPMHVSNTNGPWVFHYCQLYSIGPYFFGKRRIKNQIQSCTSPILAEPPTNVYDLYDYAYRPSHNRKVLPGNTTFKDMAVKKRAAFTMCFLLPFINDAATYYRQQHCPAGTANYTKSLMLALL